MLSLFGVRAGAVLRVALPSTAKSNQVSRLHALAARSTPMLLSAARRTFLTTAPVELPAKASAAAAGPKKSAPKKSAPKKSAPKKSAVKKSAPKKQAATKRKPAAKKAAAKKPIKREPKPKPTYSASVLKANRPPKRPVSPYVAFAMKWRAGLDETSKESMIEEARHAGRAWKALSAAEQQPFSEEFKAQLEDWHRRNFQWAKTVDPAILKEMNRRRSAKGATRLRLPRGSVVKKPINGFLRFYVENRNSLIADLPAGLSAREHMVAASKAASRAWAALTDEEKKPYGDAYHEAVAEWTRTHGPKA